jgi:hypothetical protein
MFNKGGFHEDERFMEDGGFSQYPGRQKRRIQYLRIAAFTAWWDLKSKGDYTCRENT